ncbi:hypothetical protein C8Q80DRAFT_1125603 [Daedaleopsis nitida]|nr:hypothetical protein C8Q80DRAFT_1125603 [Daedaleopsis nitida]
MAPRWHLLAEEKFINDIPGTLPPTISDPDSPPLVISTTSRRNGHLSETERDRNSVFQEAGCTGLRFLITADHKDNTGTKRKSDTFNDGGIYETTKLVNDATTVKLTANERKVTNPLALKLLDSATMDVHPLSRCCPLEVKYNYGNSAFKFHSVKEESS